MNLSFCDCFLVPLWLGDGQRSVRRRPAEAAPMLSWARLAGAGGWRGALHRDEVICKIAVAEQSRIFLYIFETDLGVDGLPAQAALVDLAALCEGGERGMRGREVHGLVEAKGFVSLCLMAG